MEKNALETARLMLKFRLAELFSSLGFAIFEHATSELWDLETLEFLEAAYGAPPTDHQLVRTGYGPNGFISYWSSEKEWKDVNGH